MPQMLQWRSNKYYIFNMCVCRLWYPACSAHAPYCKVWPVHLINGMIFKNKLLNINVYFDFLYNFCLKHYSF